MNKSDLKTGMIVTLRRGVERVIIGERLFEEEEGFITNTLENYNDDLTYTNNCTSEDIMKIIYGGEVIWERVEWENVPFGTKVRVWDDDGEVDYGRFILYDEETCENMPFLVFVEDEKDVLFFKYCEIIKEEC